jgi:hypothetical protein
VPLLRRALGLLQLAAATPPVRLGEPCSSTPTPAPPMPTPADDLAQLMAAVLAYRTQPWAWPRPRPAYLPHPRRRLPRLRGVVRVLATDRPTAGNGAGWGCCQ